MNQLTENNALRPPDDTGPAGYEDDFLVWIKHQAELLRANKFEQLDVSNLIEELDAMAGSQLRELQSRLTVLIAHLLTCRCQRAKQSRSWLSTLHVQRTEIGVLIEQSPSLNGHVMEYAVKMYRAAVKRAAIETGRPVSEFPAEIPFTRSELLDPDFVP